MKKCFDKKSDNAEKTERGYLECFNIHSVSKLQTLKMGPFGYFLKKSPTRPKKNYRGHFSLVRYCKLREKKENLFGSVP